MARPRMIPGHEKSVLDRLADKFTVGDECWLWTGGTRSGYGVVRVGPGRRAPLRAAHAVLYELLVRPVSEGLELDHLCRVRACVRPAHLEPVTHAENMRRGQATRTPEERSESARRWNATKTPEERSEIVRRAWVTRRGV